MPVSSTGQRVSVAPYDRADGFSPGSAAIVHVPGLDNAAAFARTGAAGVLDMGTSLRRNQPIVIVDEQTGRRQLIWSELDANATTPDTTNLLIHGAKAFVNGHTYVVALRNLRTATGRLIPAPKWFERLRDNRRLPANESSQRARYASIFAALARAGVRRSNLYEAWDFTVASRQNVTGRLLSIRDSAFAGLGDRKLADGKVAGRAPSYTITSTKTLSPQLRAVVGTFDVPCYLIECGTTAATGFHYSSSKPDALPTQRRGNVAVAPFECIIPSSAGNPSPARISLYGHGLFGDYTEVEDPWVEALATQHNIVFCGTDWWGLDRRRRIVCRDGRLEPQPVRSARRPPPAGGPEHAVPRAADGQPAWVRDQPGLPGRRPLGARHLAPVLQRQLPGRDHGRSDTGGLPGRPARGARCHRDGLRQPAAGPEHGLHVVQPVPRVVLPGSVDVSGDPRPV